MKLYHGTTEKAWSSIQKDGYIKPSNGEIYMNPKASVAKSFGDVVLEVDFDDDYLKNEIDNYRVDYMRRTKDYIFSQKINISEVKIYNL